jgi:hypothetical protein
MKHTSPAQIDLYLPVSVLNIPRDVLLPDTKNAGEARRLLMRAMKAPRSLP